MLSLPLRPLVLPLVRCCPTAPLRTYATTQAQAQAHPHHLVPPTKPSTFGQPTSKSHTHLGESTVPTPPLHHSPSHRAHFLFFSSLRPSRAIADDARAYKKKSDRERSLRGYQRRNMSADVDNWSMVFRMEAWSCAWLGMSNT
jgi:hypothetical protein